MHSLLQAPLAIVDLETTGFDYDHYRILARYLTKCVGAGGTRVAPLNKCTASF